MEEYLNKGVKEVISKFPQVADILNEYNIGCAPCSVGSCLLKDIVEIHNLSAEDEQALMARIAKVIYPDREVKMPRIERKHSGRPGAIKYSPPMKKLVDEHALIKRWLALLPAVVENLRMAEPDGVQMVSAGVDFIRNYADKYHHAKEEEILFKYFDENLDILKTMRQEHEEARSRVKAVMNALGMMDVDVVAEHLDAYRRLLTEHIKKEDEILYPWMDRNLSMTQVGRLFSRFNEVDKQFAGAPEKYEKLVDMLEKKFECKEIKK